MLTPEQKALRLTGIGGSEVGAIAGLNPWMKPIDVYRRKVEGFEEADTEAMERGRFLERGVAEWYAHRHKSKLREVGTLVWHRNKVVVCTPDFLALPESGPELDLSIKVPGPRAWAEWGEPGTDEVPEQYLVQVQWELIALRELYGITESVVAAPIDGLLKVYRVKADENCQGKLVAIAEKFWRDHVETRTPPEPDGSESYGKHLKALFPAAAEKKVITATSEAEQWAKAYFAAKEVKDLAEEKQQVARQHLERLIGDAYAMNGDDFRITFGLTKGKPKTDWEKVCEEAKVPQALVDKYTSRSPFRQFRPTSKKEAA